MTMMTWSDETYALGVDRMDDTHREFVELVNACDSAADKAAFVAAFKALLAHTEQHFAFEDSLMQQTAFSSAEEHIGEHRKVLAEMAQFLKRAGGPMSAFAREYVRERLPEWFGIHASTMDSALAFHLKGTADAEALAALYASADAASGITAKGADATSATA